MVDTRMMLGETRRRATGSIMRFCEAAPWYEGLRREDKMALRNKVLESIGLYHDCVLDVVKAIEGSEQTGVVNERAMELLEHIHGIVTDRRVTGETVHGGGRPLALAEVHPEHPFLEPSAVADGG